MTEIVRCALLAFNVFSIISQLSTWNMNYGFAMGVQLDMCFSFLLFVLLLFRSMWGPISLPFLQNGNAQVIYIASSSIVAGLAAVRVVYCLYIRHLLLNHWPSDDRTVSRPNAWMVSDLVRIRTHID
ncbi:hypothetical protein PHMEG_00018372 [Phytophthora megakarya]|uniref:Transmembrane protein n=1 Tax=Phytophthora megakarya TaxID=4795 RepID=A0A225VU88_9STRA|nr:hypothetical protein PHMEG_00018372 [Phytophthora megakarya]